MEDKNRFRKINDTSLIHLMSQGYKCIFQKTHDVLYTFLKLCHLLSNNQIGIHQSWNYRRTVFVHLNSSIR